ncbi:hypothetical protein H7F10_04435 [Acidithiobacillus sp. HP-6]|uniref:hypothetical protein n=1 Tax=unclassified Acidithiobacillus TaxID=2614800 RepID=UPI0018796AC0|nr:MULTISPECIES: hypothetical protein [unclassified Acidithiobacillus]MBE7562218.1 hypothetical protein [Acidithiobacillus sp. HP-6]MBE7568943.1 hypothetical protein [Acidithiobacillus sp. HP-2]
MGVSEENWENRNHKRMSRAAQYFSTRREWMLPDLLVNPIGTLIIWDGKGWQTAPWLDNFMQVLRSGLLDYEDLRTMISLPIRQNVAEYWDLVLLTSGLNGCFGDKKKATLWPQEPPVSSILAMDQMAYPPKITPNIYIDCVSERMINTLNQCVEMPETVIYWRPSQANIAAMEAFGVIWDDMEEALINVPEVQFAGQPEDVISILGRK